MTKDPVCGMQVDEKQAAGQAEYRGKTYFFCSIPCKKKFEESPEKFVEEQRA